MEIHTVQQKKTLPNFQLLDKWTNLKATLADVGPDISCYQDHQPFSALELRKHMGLYIFNDLSPLPKVENKFYPQRQDEFHGNDVLYNSFGPNSERRHRHFRAFFHAIIQLLTLHQGLCI